MLNPSETAHKFIEIGKAKTGYPFYKTLVLSILAGAFIAFAAEGSSFAIHTISSTGIGKTVAGALFSTGLIMTVLGGAELFTGNTLIAVSCLAGQNKWPRFLKNLSLVFLGNFMGAMIIVLLVSGSGQLNATGGQAGGFTIKVAAGKTSLSFLNGICSGALCCWLVCMGVWMAASSKDVTGKIFSCFFPIWLFITSGFEHSIANMYYIPAGLLAKANPGYIAKALELGVTESQLAGLNWGKFLYGNLLPVTIGNLIGGTIFVAVMFFVAFIWEKKDKEKTN
jgi:formate/nitrite transporter